MNDQTQQDAAWEHAQRFIHDNLHAGNGFFGDFKLLAVNEGDFEIAYEMKRLFIKPERITPDPPSPLVQTVTIEIKGTWRISNLIWKGDAVKMLQGQMEADFENAFRKYCQEHGWQL